MTSGPLPGPLRAVLALACVALAVAGCSSDDDPPPPPQTTTVTTTFRGVFAGKAGEGGTVTLTTTVTTSAVYASTGLGRLPSEPSSEARRVTGNVSGTFNIAGGGSAALTGTYETATGVLRATGGGFVFTGTLIEGDLFGNYTRTGNSGGFVAVVPTSASYQAYCGTWSGADGGGNPDIGSVCLVVDGATVTGSAAHEDGAFAPLTGSHKGSGVIFTFPYYAFEGTIAGPEVHGNYTSSLDSRSGGWTAALTAF